MKKLAKQSIANILGGYVKKLRQKHDFTVIAVVGSIGKTSTKFAIARVLGEEKRVLFQEGNYNDLVSVPLIFFGLPMPSITNPAAWYRTFAQIRAKLKKDYPYDVVVVELGTDGPGQIRAFGKYLKVDIAVISAITPEHMEYFPDMDAVAKEELSVQQFSDQLITNSDLADKKYTHSLGSKLQTYGMNTGSDFQIKNVQFKDKTATFELSHKKNPEIKLSMEAVSTAEIYSATAASAVAINLGLSTEKIKSGIAKLSPVSGRMQRLAGIKNSIIIDETYNASPVAVKAALDSLYAMDAPQKIVILGNMNELGHMSESAHLEVGAYCEPKQLDLVVTIGPDANKYLAEAAKGRGCAVASFNDPFSAGEFVKNRIKSGAVVLAKGSQNGVFAEEAVKLLLKNSADESKLVRQSPEWLKKKSKNLS